MSAAASSVATGATGYVVTLTGGGDYTMGNFDYMVQANLTGGATNVILPDATKVGGMRYTVVRTVNAINALTVKTQSGQTINGSSTLTMLLTLFSAQDFVSDGANWIAV